MLQFFKYVKKIRKNWHHNHNISRATAEWEHMAVEDSDWKTVKLQAIS